MKRTKHIAFLVLALITLGACEYLEYDESSYLLEDQVFSDFDRTKQFLSGIYAYLPDGFNPVDGAMRSSATDDAIHVWKYSSVQKFNDGSWSAAQPIDNVFGTMYNGIRAVNKFLVETDGQIFEDEKYNEDYGDQMLQFNYYPYEARYLRAFFYFELAKRYGAVPLITEPLTQEEANTVSQASFNTLIQFVVDECSFVADSLPVTYANLPNGETGRATRGAALALKARALLYAASPLHNEANNPELWAAAAEAAHDVIYLGFYELEGNYGDLYNNHESMELILGRNENETNTFERNNFPIGFEGGNTGTCPTQNLVEAYGMQSSGLPIDDPGSGYDPNFPYQDRDPRMYETILANGDAWKGKTIETWYGGANAAPKPNATLTGYYLKKYVIESINLTPTNTTRKNHTWILFRYGEVLLNYAEAMNEVYGPEDPSTFSMSALQAVNEVRLRAGMPEFPAGMTQSEFRKKLRNERRVELAFEDHRFWDIRRWKIGEETINIYGILITENIFGGYAYNKKLVEKRIFEERMNLYPIPESELFINSDLTQNAGW